LKTYSSKIFDCIFENETIIIIESFKKLLMEKDLLYLIVTFSFGNVFFLADDSTLD
jgi:hypothetical protein